MTHTKVEVYTSGWGRVFSACVTNERGPLKHLKCKKPFLHRGKRFDGCSSGRNPSAQVHYVDLAYLVHSIGIDLGSGL